MSQWEKKHSWVYLRMNIHNGYYIYCRHKNLLVWPANYYRRRPCHARADVLSPSRFGICHGHLIIVFVVLPPWPRCLHIHHRCCHCGGDGNRNDIDHCRHVAGHCCAGPSNEFEWGSSSSGVRVIPSSSSWHCWLWWY